MAVAGPDPTPRPPVPPAPPASDRLDSWKEIATYLKREMRTVQRWEQREGLPVHRHVHTTQGTVFAYKAELDVWWNDGHQRLDTALDTASETAALRPRLLRWPVAIAAGVLLTATMATGLWFLARPGLDFEARDWVLIADFENQTGGAIADGTVEYALAHALGESRFVNVVPRERVVDTLGLMRRLPETAVDAAVGREIALRDGGIRAILTGRVDRLDTTYALSAVLVEPATGRRVASVREEAAGDSAFLPAVHRLSNRVRARLGEALADIERSARALEKVTTPSLSALQLFSEADRLLPLGKSDVAEELLRQAVAEDPDFASGYMQLALTIRYQLRPAPEYLPPAERAVALAERVSERERYYILGSYHEMLGQAAQAARDQDLATIEYEQAVTVLEALVRLYPDHYWGTSRLAYTNEQLGRMEEAWRWLARRADLRPTRLPQTVNLARHFLVIGDVAAAEPYLERARTLASAEGADPIHVVQASILHARYFLGIGDVAAAEPYLERARALASAEWKEPRWEVQASILHARYFLGIGDVAAAKPFVELARALASAEGTDPRWVVRTSFLQAEYFLGIGDVAAAEPYIERARALASVEGSDPRWMVQANFLKVDAAWLGRDAEQALAALNEVVASGPPQTSRARDLWLSAASLSYHMLGMLDAAHDMGLQIASEQRRCGALYLVAWARADLPAARDPLRCVARPAASAAGNRIRALILLARAGAPEEAREILEWWKAQPVDPPTVMGLSPARVVAALISTVRGELARLEGRVGEAIPLLEQGAAAFPGFYLASTRSRWPGWRRASRRGQLGSSTRPRRFPGCGVPTWASAGSQWNCDGPRCTGSSGVSRRPSRSRPAYERSSRTPIPITSSSAN